MYLECIKIHNVHVVYYQDVINIVFKHRTEQNVVNVTCTCVTVKLVVFI